jgi:hypothetical protein
MTALEKHTLETEWKTVADLAFPGVTGPALAQARLIFYAGAKAAIKIASVAYLAMGDELTEISKELGKN